MMSTRRDSPSLPWLGDESSSSASGSSNDDDSFLSSMRSFQSLDDSSSKSSATSSSGWSNSHSPSISSLSSPSISDNSTFVQNNNAKHFSPREEEVEEDSLIHPFSIFRFDRKKEDTVALKSPLKEKSNIVVSEDEEKKEKVIPHGSLLDIVPEGNEEEQEENDGMISWTSTSCSDSTASCEIPPPPPPEDERDNGVHTNNVCKTEASLQQSTVAKKSRRRLLLLQLSKYKTNVPARLIQAMNEKKPRIHHSSDLVPLTKKYQVFRKMLMSMIISTKAYQKAALEASEARTKLFQDYAILSEGTPLYDHVGSLQSIEKSRDVALVTTSEGLELQTKPSEQVANDLGARSLFSLQQVAISNEKINAADYQSQVLDYATEWEQFVTSMIDKELLVVKRLQRNQLHYERKVSGLHRKVNSLEPKGKRIPQALIERLSRNEQKLKTAWETHEHRADKLCVLIEQVTEQGWEDLYPLIKNATTWEVNRVGRENATYGRLPSTIDAMKVSYQRHT